MTSSSKSPVTIPQIKHDVFVSFSGVDIRNNFLSHLDAAFKRNQITAFIDDQLTKGDEISPALLTAIETSVISVVIFSKQYASSRWCLDELVKILECKNNYGQIVIPVFYHVDPSHVRNQEGIFGESFSHLKERFQNKLDKLDKLKSWETALRETANLSGSPINGNRPEYEFLEEIIDDVLKRLNNKCGSHDMDHLIGVKSIITKLESLLSTAPTSVCTLGIWGIGGIGKTTIACAIFERISNDFEGSCLIENVREKQEKIGLDQLKQQLFSSLLEGKNEKIDLNRGTNFYLRRLKLKKVVVVFDDVTRFDQIEYLIGSLDSFGDGSQIIITTRDRKVLDRANVIYEMKGLLYNEALALFSQHVFQQNDPIAGFEDLTRQIIYYCGGVPLALKVLGRFLFKREKMDWESQIKKLKNIPHEDILKVLRISYDNLDPHDKRIFLDIVCFFKWMSKDDAIELLDVDDVSPGIAIKTLEEKCLIIISDNTITMHDLVEEMGKEIIRLESIDYPEKRSRLWHNEDIYSVLQHKTGTEAIQGISFKGFNFKEMFFEGFSFKERSFELCTFKKMRNLRYLEFYSGNMCNISHCPEPVFFKLSVLHWNGYPLESLPFHHRPEYLRSLSLCYSKIKTLWDGNQNLHNLKYIDLSDSYQLEKLPDLKSARNLENLILKGCSNLVEIDLPDQLTKLVYVDVSCCESLKSLSPKIHSESLKHIDLSFCKQLEKLLDLKGYQNLDKLIIKGCLSLDEIDLPDQLNKLVCLDLRKCKSLKSLRPKIHSESLKHINFSFCKQLEKLLDLKDVPNLENLILKGCSNLVEIDLPDQLNKLVLVDVRKCEGLERLPSKIHSESLNNLLLSGCTNLTRFSDLISCNIEELKLVRIGIDQLPSSVECLSRLAILNISNCSRLKQILFPTSLCKLKSLRWLFLSDCPNLKRLPDNLGHLEGLQQLFVEKTPIRKVPSSIGSLQSLEFLKMSGCSITKLPESLGKLSSLQVLCLSHCLRLKGLPGTLGNLKRLWRLHVEGTALRKVPSSIVNLLSLEILSLTNCYKLLSLPKLPENIEFLSVANCKSLQVLPSKFSIFLATKAVDVDLRNCTQLQNKLSKIVKKGLRNTQHWETSRSHYSEFLRRICYPGSEIPDWFEFRGMESSGSVRLPRGLFQNNLIGVVVCTILKYSEDVEFNGYDDALGCYWKVTGNDNILIQGYWGFAFPRKDSDHVILCRKMDDNLFGYGFDESLNNDEVLIQFSTKRNDVNCSVVKEWGIHFLYGQDSREFMKDFSSDEESHKDEQEEQEEDDDDSNQGESESEEESNEEQEVSDLKRWKLSIGESESEKE